MLENTRILHTLNRLPEDPRLNNGTGGCIVDKLRINGLILHEKGDFALAQKEGPYAEKDCMIIYTGPDTSKTKFVDFSPEEQYDFIKLASRVAVIAYIENIQAIIHGKLLFSLGINTAFVPKSGVVQSVSRPHFHVTLFPTTPGVSNNIETKIVTLTPGDKNEERVFALLPLNRELRDEFSKTMHRYQHRKFLHNAIDFDLNAPGNIFIDSLDYFDTIYRSVENFLKTKNIIASHQIGYSSAFVYDPNNNTWLLRIGFFEKPDASYNSGVSEANGHAIQREDDSSKLPDQTKFFEPILRGLNHL